MANIFRATAQATVAAFLLAGSAFAQGDRAELSVPFTASTPATESGLTMDLRYFNPADRDGKPPAIQDLAIHLPRGTRLDPGALPVCSASDAEIHARGRDACPPESLVGTGRLWVYLGAPGDPQATDLALFNGPGQLIEVLLFEGTNTTAAIERLAIDGAVLRAKPLQVPPAGPPERRFAASRIVWDIPAHGRYLVTPPSCGGTWTTIGEFAFADGGRTRVQSTQACERARGTHTAAPPSDAQRRRRRTVLVAYRKSASARWIRRHSGLGVALRVDGRLRGVRARLVEQRTGRTVAAVRTRALVRDAAVRLRLRSAVRPGPHRLIVTARTEDDARVRATRRVRIRR